MKALMELAMNLLDALDKNGVREFFSKGWITHDAMWYYACLQELGPHRANLLNKKAVASMATVEIRRIVKLMAREMSPIRKFDDLKEVIDTGFQLILPVFMKLHYSFPEKNVLLSGFRECFAYEGAKKFGAGDVYECGVAVRVRAWLDTLGVQYKVIPDFSGCLMRDRGRCETEYHFNLE